MIEPETDWGGPRVFFDIGIGGKNVGRIKIELRPDICPKSCENFRQLCTGEYRPRGVPIGYLNTKFHRIIRGFMVQGGDCDTRDGYGLLSIYGHDYEDEPSAYKFDQPGIVAMANSGPNTNGCQFFITFDAFEELNGKYVTIGKVIDGMYTLRMIECAPLRPNSEEPSYDITVLQCGEL